MSALRSAVRPAQGSRSDRQRRLGLEQAGRPNENRASKAACANSRSPASNFVSPNHPLPRSRIRDYTTPNMHPPTRTLQEEAASIPGNTLHLSSREHERRDRILLTATRLIAIHGRAAITLPALAAAMHLTPRAVQKLFPCLDTILVEILHRHLQSIANTLAEIPTTPNASKPSAAPPTSPPPAPPSAAPPPTPTFSSPETATPSRPTSPPRWTPTASPSPSSSHPPPKTPKPP